MKGKIKILNKIEEAPPEKEQASEVLEISEETAEEKERREIENNINALSQKAEKRIQEMEKQKAEKTKISRDELEKRINADPPTVATLELINQELEKNKSYKNRLEKRLEKAGADKKLATLVYYLETEHSIKDYKWETEWIKTKDVEEIFDYYKVEGREARKTNKKSFLERKTAIEVKKETFYVVSSKEEYKNLAELMEQSNDPIEIIERLKRIGINICGDNLRKNFEGFKKFVSQPKILEILRGLNILDFRADKKIFGEDEDFSREINDFLENQDKTELFEKENLKELLKFEKIFGLNVFEFKNSKWDYKYNFQNILNLLQMSSDKSAREIIDYIFVNLDKKNIKDTVYSLYTFKNILSIQKSDLLSEIAEFIKSIPAAITSPLIEDLLTRENFSNFNKEQWQESFEKILYKETQELRDNPELNDFVKKFLTINEQNRLHPVEIKTFKNLYSYKNKKEIIALCEFTKELGSLANVLIISDTMNTEVFKDKIVFKPEFAWFVKELREKFSFKTDDLLYHIREAAKIFNDIELKNDLLSEKTVSFFKNINEKFAFNFSINIKNVEYLIFASKDADFQELLENDEAVKFMKNSLYGFDLEPRTLAFIKNMSFDFYPMLDTLFRTFNFTIDQRMGNIALEVFIKNLSLLKENQNEILPLLIKFKDLGWLNNKMIKEGGGELKNIVQDEILKEKIFNFENIDFINKTIEKQNLSIEDISTITLIEEDKKRAAKQLADDFNLKIYPFEVYKDNVASSVTASLINSDSLQKELAENNFENYKIIVSQKICVEFLKNGDAAHEFLEKITEKGWITIQTYNRLYAARRKNIGFESYAYRPKVGETHPIINVTFYGMEFGENRLKNNKQFTVSSYEDADGFYEGDSGGVKIKIYPETYKIYKEALEKYKNYGEETEKKFFENFSWYAKPKKYKEEYKQEEFLTNNALPAGPAPNGHSHFYFTPYGIVSGCVSEASQQSDILRKDHPLSKGAWLITGHKEMLLDFLKNYGEISSYKKEIETIPAGAITVKIENLNLPKQLERMILPPNITLGEMILNLHLEQYLHKGMAVNEFLLNDIMEQLNSGEIIAKANGKILKLEDRIEPSTKIIFEKQFKEKEAMAS